MSGGNKIYGIPGTPEWMCIDFFTEDLASQGYVEMSGYPPTPTQDELLSGQRYVASDVGEWVLEEDPAYRERLIRSVQKFYGTNKISPKMVEGYVSAITGLLAEPTSAFENDDDSASTPRNKLKPHIRK